MAGVEVPVCPEIRLQEVTLQGLASFAGDLEEHKKLDLVQPYLSVSLLDHQYSEQGAVRPLLSCGTTVLCTCHHLLMDPVSML